MAQRRSKNRRLSARRSNVSGFLNDDTNVYDNNDPLWYDRTAVRPSTSLRLSKHTSAVLDPDSTVHASQLADDWFEDLSQSDSSKLLKEVVKKKTSKSNEEPGESDQASAATESESEHELQKKRANLRFVKKPSDKSNKSNAFIKALERTTDSHTRNLTHARMLEGNESESTHDESKTLMKLRPKFTRRAKNNTNNFDMALESDSASERVDNSRMSLRSSKRISEVDENFATPEKQQRLKSVAEVSHGTKSVEKLQNKSVNKTKDNTSESSVRELRNRSVQSLLGKSAAPADLSKKSSSTKKGPAVDQSPDVSSSSPEVQKDRRSLFSQGNRSAAEKSKGDKSAFESFLDSVNDSEENEASLTEPVSTSKKNEENNTQDDEDDSDSSSIPKNIRRTRSRSLFGERRSDETGDVNTSKRELRARKKDSSKNASQSSKDKSTADQSNASDKHETTRTNLTIAGSSDKEEIFSASLNRSKPTEHEKSNKSEAAKTLRLSVESSESEDMIDASHSETQLRERDKTDKTESSRLQVPSIESSDDEDMINISSSKIEPKKTNVSKKSRTSNDKANKSRASKSISSSDKNEYVPTSPEVSTRQSRSRLLQKKNASKNENPFDQITFNDSSAVKDKSKEKEIEDTPKLSQQSPKAINRSRKSQSINVSNNKFTSRESSKNDSKADVSDDETSTIAKHIRRTRSRLFQTSKAGDEDNAFEDALDVENVPENRSVFSQKSRTLNKPASRTSSVLRDVSGQKSIWDAMKNKPRIILDKVVRPADSANLLSDSYEENQENRHPNTRKSVAYISLNKEKPVNNSQANSAPNEHRSVETSSDGTPAPVSPQEASTPLPPPRIPTALRSKLTSAKLSPAKSAQNSTFDDLLHTPNPAQSTLNPHGKPVNRITQFSFRTVADLEERTPTPAADAPEVVPRIPIADDEDVDVTGESDVEDYPLLTRQLNDIPYDKEKTTFDEDEEATVTSKSANKKTQGVPKQKSSNENNEKESPIDWEKAKKHTDAIKMMVDAQLRLAEEARKKRELKEHRIDVKFKRLQTQKEAELKRKNKKPINKAFLVDGKVYKQPNLPRPKSWATDKLYKHLRKCMYPKYGIRTRVKSEEFVVQLSDFAKRISKRRKFENYSGELDELMLTMAKLDIIKTRYDFYRFTTDFMPFDFREKVIPIAQFGNEINIPYDPEIQFKPLLNVSRSAQESDTEAS